MSLISSDYSIETDISNIIVNRPLGGLIIPFWSDNPNVLLHMAEFFPVEGMTYNQKLNAITRTVILLTVVLYLIQPSTRIVFIGLMTLGAIFMLHYYRKQEREKKTAIKDKQEGFDNPALAVLSDYSVDPIKTFDIPTDTNPFSNVLLPDYEYNPEKKPAPPAFNTNVNQTILQQAQQLVIDQNPGQPDIAKKLFTDLGEQFVFEQSLQPFYSNPATTIPNDQAGFADFCYGSMVSCKEGNLFSCARNLDRYTN
jgi:hypothetical protein